MTCPTSPTWLTGTSCSTLPASSPGLPPQPAGTEAFKLVLQKVGVQSCCTGRVYYQPNPTVSSTDVCTSFSSERNGLPHFIPTFILILLHCIERVGGSLNRALFWNMCSVLRVRIAVLQYCSTCCPVVIGVLYTVSSFVRYVQPLPVERAASVCTNQGLLSWQVQQSHLQSWQLYCTVYSLVLRQVQVQLPHLAPPLQGEAPLLEGLLLQLVQSLFLSGSATSLVRYSHLSCQVQPPLLLGTTTSLVRYRRLSCQVQPPLLSCTATSLVRYSHLSCQVYHLSCQIQPPLLSGTATSLVRYNHLSCQIKPPLFSYSHLSCQIEPPLLSDKATSLVSNTPTLLVSEKNVENPLRTIFSGKCIF